MKKTREREILLERFVSPLQLCKLALERGMVEKCEKEISTNDLQQIITELAETLKGKELRRVIKERGGAFVKERFFRGEHYTLLGGELKQEGGTEPLKADLKSALRKHKWKAFYPLICALELEEFGYDSMVRCLAEKNVDYMPNQMLFLLTNKYRILLRIEKGEKKFWKVPEEAYELVEDMLERAEKRIHWYKRIRKK
ncbi:MAG: hypothetical protein GWO20_20780 [Candidatus Korarchaeota archaeon]|nr:hypothetical protein [Candidatus Korarchaeota archaeon]NIU85655.1 hypothetical protein [Candidatus Thorarchaeota archaeon]NIW15756.1 hypothetical protein [Candidatus Thorarchaeota archaeon]NIW53672.1 hypothetical protein [Candidatus Korarchaeota archaeon]